jgi:SPP1 gp7 family putative phage head morphogenesis protein
LRKRRDRTLKPIRPSRKNELWYRSELVRIADLLRAAGTRIAEKIRPRWPVVADAPPPEVAEAIREAQHHGFTGFEHQSERLARAAAIRNMKEVDERLIREIKRSVSVDVRAAFDVGGPIAHKMDAAVKWNASLIQSIPEQYFGKLGDLVSSGWADGKRWESLVADIQNLGDVTEERAKVIARDQTAKMNSAFNQTRQQSVGIEKYEWSTSQDERVRETHAELDGKTFRWDEPGPLAGTIDGAPCHAGEDILCRCTALPVFDLDEMEAEVAALEREAA